MGLDRHSIVDTSKDGREKDLPLLRTDDLPTNTRTAVRDLGEIREILEG